MSKLSQLTVNSANVPIKPRCVFRGLSTLEIKDLDEKGLNSFEIIPRGRRDKNSLSEKNYTGNRSRDVSPGSHVADGNLINTPFISTTKNLATAKRYDYNGGIAEIDTTTLQDSNIIDLTDGNTFKACIDTESKYWSTSPYKADMRTNKSRYRSNTNEWLEPSALRNNVNNSQEVLVSGSVPTSSIMGVYRRNNNSYAYNQNNRYNNANKTQDKPLSNEE